LNSSTRLTAIIQIHSNVATAEKVAQTAKLDAEQPELDLSRVRGTPEQIKEIERIRDEIVRMHSEAETKMALAWTQYNSGSTRASGGRLASIARPGGVVYNRVNDGHGNWFDSESEAKGSQMMIEAKYKMDEAWDLRRKVILKRGEIIKMKALLTPGQ
jgi:hypothetical protein